MDSNEISMSGHDGGKISVPVVPIEVRRAVAGDVPAIGRLLLQVCAVHAAGRPDLFRAGGRKYSDAELEGILSDDSTPVFVACGADGEVCGHAFCVVEERAGGGAMRPCRTLYVDDICVDERARGRHVGTALYDHVVAWAGERGFYNVTLNVWSCNPGALRFYEAMGMKPYKVGMERVLRPSS